MDLDYVRPSTIITWAMLALESEHDLFNKQCGPFDVDLSAEVWRKRKGSRMNGLSKERREEPRAKVLEA
jgi:hypothetical protein